MKRINHALRYRAVCRWLVFALALGCVQVANAGFKTAQASSGAVIDWEYGFINQSAQFMPAPGSKVSGNTGYLVANGALNGVSTTRLPVGPSYIDVTARVVPDKLSTAKAIVGFMSKVAFPLQIGIAAYDLLKELNYDATRDASGALKLTKPDPDACTAAPCFVFSTRTPQNISAQTPYLSSRRLACERARSQYSAWGNQTYAVVNDNYNPNYGVGSCYLSNVYNGTTYYTELPYFYQSTSPTAANPVPATLQELQDKIASESGWPSSSSLPQAVVDAVQSGEPITAPAPTVTGPTSVNGPTTTTNENGSTVERKTVYNINYNNNQVSYTTVVTTTTNNAGNVTTKTETTTNDQPVDECTKNPSSLNCATLDVPDDTIPKTTKNIAYTAETWFGGGACPADKFLTTHGQQIKVWDWQSTCSNLVTYFRPVLLIVAGVMAMFIVLPKGAGA